MKIFLIFSLPCSFIAILNRIQIGNMGYPFSKCLSCFHLELWCYIYEDIEL